MFIVKCIPDADGRHKHPGSMTMTILLTAHVVTATSWPLKLHTYPKLMEAKCFPMGRKHTGLSLRRKILFYLPGS
jgi:hypothetical protein